MPHRIRGCIITTHVRIGRHAIVNLACTIGHDTSLEDFATLGPGVHVSGLVEVQEAAYVGTGSTLINGGEGRPLIIGHDAVVGAGACLIRDVAPGTTAVGVPAALR